jgi:hypothetical protein
MGTKFWEVVCNEHDINVLDHEALREVVFFEFEPGANIYWAKGH